ncbi:porin family protein [Fulvivirga lutea]|uniref:Uncharacterized protein n=1 Tax=Fulvivirga lutea TaxID=2810512 RepID=A0A975A1U6_9BACT|nr:hypothetical protein [Fulvivirga lutea]QSE98721.1 hypothetical protein JR347_06470 [Fulvivirga lutea]
MLCSINSYSQNLESIGQSKPIEVSGGLSLSNIIYAADGIDQRRDPYTYFASGNVTLSLYGWSVPFSFAFSNQNSSFQQPFNQYGLHPTYKWITGHIGYTSMSFSPYTLNGHLFLGAGVDLQPTDKLSISAMYGRLQKAVQPDSTNESVLPAFHRTGFGLKTSYGSASDNVTFIFFSATDDENSLNYVPESLEVLPRENLVLSLAGSKTIVPNLVLKGEFATSALTRDKRAASYEPSNKNIFSTGIFNQKQSTGYYNAYNLGVSYAFSTFSIGAGYERIDPGYETLGAYFFNNNLENITANANTALFSGKVNVGVNAGLQRDNLDGEKVSSMSRFVGSMNVGYTPSNRLNIAVNYSSFNTYTNIRSQFQDINQLTPYDNLDTLNFTQISQSVNSNVNYMLSTNEARRQNINVNITYQNAADEQGGVEQNSGSQFYMFNAAYNLSIVPTNTSFTLAFNYNKNEAAGLNSTTLGPTLGINKTLLDKKMRTGLSVSLNNAYTNNQLVNRVVNYRLTGSYTLKKKHAFNISAVALNRTTVGEDGAVDFLEFTGTIGYNLTLGN